MLESILSMLQSSVTDAQKAAAAAQLNAKREEPALASASAKFEQQRQVLRSIASPMTLKNTPNTMMVCALPPAEKVKATFC